MRFPLILAALLIITAARSLYAQENEQNYSINKVTPGRPINYHLVKPKSAKGKSVTEEIRIIVRFKSDPISKVSKNSRSNASGKMENERSQFLQDIERLSSTTRSASATPSVKILHDYRNVLNGISIVTTNFTQEQIKKLTYVSAVVEDKEIHVSDLSSSSIIRAPLVWSELNITGKGITIGIIDTGIDYNHPDLGGGFGSGFKVKGGYDFVNNDNDPLDDHGHGTHVAGIAAADGPGLKGVAPGANLIAYKALSDQGFGYDSWILAAIERTVDPDQNPNTDDALDVVNMSLGRQPDATDLLSEAVNNAVAQGVTYVIAAGNDYDNLTIGSPGIAEQAITVGATDNNDYTANFSSKGPSMPALFLKPDVAAPGVNIYSSFKNGGYETLSGTSMATPHVAGAVALLLEKHPDWSPAMLKASLMNTAKKSYEAIWNQGAGRVDVYDAIKTKAIVTPGSFSMGKPAGAQFTKTVTTTIFNENNVTTNYTAYVDGNILNEPAIAISLSATTFTLSAHSSRTIDVTFTINTPSLPQVNIPDAFTGSLVVTSMDQTINSPIVIVNPQITTLQFNGKLPYIVFAIGAGGNYFFKGYSPTSSKLDLLLPQGKYDLISMYSGDSTVVTEGMVTDQNKTINLSQSLAKNRIILKPLDQNGNAVTITKTTSGNTVFSGKGRNFMTLYLGVADTLCVSDLIDYRYDMRVYGKAADSLHFSDIVVSSGYNINQSKTYSNDPAKFSELTINNPSIKTDQKIVYYSQIGGFTTWNNAGVKVKNPLRILLGQKDYENLIQGAYARLSPVKGDPGYIWETGAFKSMDNGKMILQDKISDHVSEITASSFNYNLGESIVRISQGSSINSQKIGVTDPYYLGYFNRYFGERERGTIYYKLYDGQTKLKEGALINNTANDIISTQSRIMIDAPVAQKPYTLQLTYDDYQVRGKFGKALVSFDFNTAKEDMNPPHVTYLSLDVNNKSVNQFQSGQEATLVTKLDDYCVDPVTWSGCNSTGVASLSVYIKKEGATEWTYLYTNQQDVQYTTALPKTLEDGYYSLKLIAKDYSDNTLTYELNPAFLIGNTAQSTPYTAVMLIEPADNSINAGTNPQFKWSAIPLAGYTIQISETPDFTEPYYLESTTNDVTFKNTNLFVEHKTYYWRVKANVAGTNIPWSSIYSFYSGTLKNTILIEPIQAATNLVDSIHFKWAKVDGISWYELKVSTKDDFSDIQVLRNIGDTTLTVGGLLPNTKYYWKVSCVYTTFLDIYYIPSTVYNFETSGTVTEVYPTLREKIAYVFPNPVAANTSVVFQTEKPGEVHLIIYNHLGQPVNHLKKSCSAGVNTIVWNTDNQNKESVAEGLYVGILQTPSGTSQVKMVVKR